MASHLLSWCPVISPQPLRFSSLVAQAQFCNTGEAHIAETLRNTAVFIGFILGLYKAHANNYAFDLKKITTEGKLRTSKMTSPDSPKPLSVYNMDKVQVFIGSQGKGEDSPIQGARTRQVSPTTEISPWRFTLRKGQKVEFLHWRL